MTQRTATIVGAIVLGLWVGGWILVPGYAPIGLFPLAFAAVSYVLAFFRIGVAVYSGVLFIAIMIIGTAGVLVGFSGQVMASPLSLLYMIGWLPALGASLQAYSFHRIFTKPLTVESPKRTIKSPYPELGFSHVVRLRARGVTPVRVDIFAHATKPIWVQALTGRKGTQAYVVTNLNAGFDLATAAHTSHIQPATTLMQVFPKEPATHLLDEHERTLQLLEAEGLTPTGFTPRTPTEALETMTEAHAKEHAELHGREFAAALDLFLRGGLRIRRPRYVGRVLQQRGRREEIRRMLANIGDGSGPRP